MCGIAGFVGFGFLDGERIKDTAQKMGDAIKHRGPDTKGFWHDDESQVIMVHRRLSILDLSTAGHQPMISASSRYVIVFNGELYNHTELREMLDTKILKDGVQNGNAWRGHSDTETLLAGIEFWGLDEALNRSVGMFAFALWDKREKVLTLVRDRMGEKPLYYGWQRGVFLFGSELKSLKVHPAFEGEIDRGAIALLMRHNYIPAPYSIYSGIHKLQPGHYVKIVGSEKREQNTPKPYWSFPQCIEKSQSNLFINSDTEAVNELDVLMRSAVAQQMVADVPLGAFLSGGIDSSTVVAMMQSLSDRPVKTFTIGLDETDYNEAVHAKAVAKHLGTEHTELYITSKQAMDVIPLLPSLYDEPFSDSSQIPTFLVSELTRQHVTVSLSGDGGDELFGGYNRYNMTSSFWNKIKRVPVPVRSLIATGLKTLSPDRWNQLAKWIPGTNKYVNFGDKLHKGAGVLTSETSDQLYLNFLTHWEDPASIVINGTEPPTQITNPQLHLGNNIEQMMALDSVSYLPDDILCKVDRAAMGVSLETRVPLLDHRIVEFAWRLPLSMKIRGGQGKWILRQVLYKYVPKELVERPKMGFGVPIDAWLRGPLRDWAEALIDSNRIKEEGLLEHKQVMKKWKEHLSGERNWQHHLWDILMFQAWFEQQ